MSMTSRFKPWKIRRSGSERATRRGDRARRASVRPSVLCLEDRRLLAVFTVTTATDTDTVNGDPGSLRLAIINLDKSTDATNTIQFNIPGTGVQTIALKANLPTITVPVTINGYTQPGSAANTLAVGDNAIQLIELNGAGISGTGVGLNISAGNSTVEGLVINRFSGNGIELRSKGNNTIIGNFIGTNATGTAALPNGGSGISILDPTSDTIGGALASNRNIISGNTTNGISIDQNDSKASSPGSSAPSFNIIQGNYIGTDTSGTAALGNGSNGVSINNSQGNQILGNIISANGTGIQMGGKSSTGNTIQGNFIGTDATGSMPLGNNVGIDVGNGARSNVIGVTAIFPTSGSAAVNQATAASQRNVISGNKGDGIAFVDGADATIQNQVYGNYIGTKVDGINGLGNGADGILLLASNQVIGDTTTGAGNTIAFNGGAGVDVSSGSGNAILSNSIFANHTGIVLGTGANNGQAAPTLSSIVSVSGNTLIRGTFTSSPNTTVILQFYGNPSLDPAGLAEGQTLLGTITATTNSSGTGSFATVLPISFPFGQHVTATATTFTTNNTSTFSKPLVASVGTADVGVYFPTADTFALAFLNPSLYSSTPFTGQSVFQYGGHVGTNYSIPITGDFNGDGNTDVGIYVPSTDTFALAYLNSQGQIIGQRVFQYGAHVGTNYAIPVTGDFNGDGVTDVGIYSPTTDTFALAYLNPNSSSASPFLGQNVFQYGAHVGTNYSVPITGDFNGDGVTDVGLFVPTSDTFALAYVNPTATSSSHLLGQSVFQYGSNAGGVNSIPVTGDFNGDGVTDVGIYAPAIDTFALAYLNPASSSSSPFVGQSVFRYGSHVGTSYSVPITGDFNGDGVTDVGLYVPSTSLFALTYLNPSSTSSAPFLGQRVFVYGTSVGGVASVPITGDFNGKGNGTTAAASVNALSVSTDSGSAKDTGGLHALSLLNSASTGTTETRPATAIPSSTTPSSRLVFSNLIKARKARISALSTGSALSGQRGSSIFTS